MPVELARYGGYDYLITKRGSTYCCVDINERVIKTDTDAAVLLQYCSDNLTGGGTVLINTDLSISTKIDIDTNNNVVFDFLYHTLTIVGAAVDGFEINEQYHCGIRNINIVLPTTYTGNVITFKTATGNTRWNFIENIKMYPADTSRTYTGLYFNITGDGGVISRNTIRNIDIHDCAKGIYFKHEHINAWQNIDYFADIFIRRPVVGVEWDTAVDSSVHSTFFNNISVQCENGITTYGFKNLDCLDCVLMHCIPFDWVAASSIPANIVAGANRNIFINCGYKESDITDSGTYNTYIGDGYVDADQFCQRTNAYFFAGGGAGVNSRLYVCGDDGGTERRGSFRINTAGNFDIVNTKNSSMIRMLGAVNADMWLDCNGTGVVDFRNKTVTAIGAKTVTEYFPIKVGGTVKYVALVA